MRLDRIRALAGTTLAVALATGLLAACGSDDDEAQSLTVTATGSPKATQIELPASAEPGLAEITFENKTKAENEAQMVFVEGEHSAQEVVKGIASASRGGPFPPWFFAAGGAEAGPDQTAIITQVLKPGTYYAISTAADAPPKPDDLQAMKVSGEESDDELPETDATITSIDYGYETEGELKAGENEITFENTGAQPHHILANQLAEGATIEEGERFLKTQKGKSPFTGDQDDTVSTTVLDGGRSQIVTLDLKEPGTYALYCFISDRTGGPPHLIKDGMIDEAEVK